VRYLAFARLAHDKYHVLHVQHAVVSAMESTASARPVGAVTLLGGAATGFFVVLACAVGLGRRDQQELLPDPRSELFRAAPWNRGSSTARDGPGRRPWAGE
jgi:hypothetical protein